MMDEALTIESQQRHIEAQINEINAKADLARAQARLTNAQAAELECMLAAKPAVKPKV